MKVMKNAVKVVAVLAMSGVALSACGKNYKKGQSPTDLAAQAAEEAAKEEAAKKKTAGGGDAANGRTDADANAANGAAESSAEEAPTSFANAIKHVDFKVDAQTKIAKLAFEFTDAEKAPYASKSAGPFIGEFDPEKLQTEFKLIASDNSQTCTAHFTCDVAGCAKATVTIEQTQGKLKGGRAVITVLQKRLSHESLSIKASENAPAKESPQSAAVEVLKNQAAMTALLKVFEVRDGDNKRESYRFTFWMGAESPKEGVRITGNYPTALGMKEKFKLSVFKKSPDASRRPIVGDYEGAFTDISNGGKKLTLTFETKEGIDSATLDLTKAHTPPTPQPAVDPQPVVDPAPTPQPAVDPTPGTVTPTVTPSVQQDSDFVGPPQPSKSAEKKSLPLK